MFAIYLFHLLFEHLVGLSCQSYSRRACMSLALLSVQLRAQSGLYQRALSHLSGLCLPSFNTVLGCSGSDCRLRIVLILQAPVVQDLREQVRDLMLYIEAIQMVQQNGGEMAGGSASVGDTPKRRQRKGK